MSPSRTLFASLLASLALGAAVPAAAQSRAATAAVADTSPFRALDLPTPNLIRTGGGMPGPRYWQQRVDYRIEATLDTVRRALSGRERIAYTNNSPDTLRFLWLQLEQNLFNSRSRGSQIFGQDTRWGTGGAEGGFTIRSVTLAPAAAPAPKGRAGARGAPAGAAGTALAHVVDGTLMRVDLARPLAPGGRVAVDVVYEFPFGPNANRMGLEEIDGGTIYEVAQWYPRLAVYDDVSGWNTVQYYGQGEFYLEYGSFDVRLTLPANMLVAATGTLRNPEEVLTPTQRARLAKARTSDSTVVIRGVSEVNDPASRPRPAGGMLTWHFTADSVRDFAWAAARHFVWDAARANGGRTLAQSFYPPSADSIWNQSTQYVRFAIENYGRWMRYPYPVAINVNGVEGGMEYPMIVFCHNRTNAQALFSVTDHEFGHTWWPMIVGSNERLYPWMDEGFNTFQNYYNWETKYPGQPNRRGNMQAYLDYLKSPVEKQPLMTPADRQVALGQTAYNKPGLGLRLLRDVIIGPERFDGAMREYARRWAYKHPTPADWFRTIEDVTGEDLAWFWRGWFYTTATLDQAVEGVQQKTDSAGRLRNEIVLRTAGGLVMPVRVQVTFDDGSVEKLALPVEVWFGGDRYVALVPGPKKVTGVVLDPDNVMPDVNRDNNRWGTPAK
ncbi:MAG TPA: M1 family metallopeptidase [Gemmatimonadales bacterium]|nr:M1 family metallopeptidase [Gemmatimonadales bacterium]